MNMNDSLGITFAFLAGLAAGMFFLWSLWRSVRRLPNSHNPALLMLTGFLVRMTVVLGVLGGLAMRGDWRWLVAAAIGFALIRTVGVRVIAQRDLSFQLGENNPSQTGNLRHGRAG
jgi:F1F0 ATPase subunit 2